MTTENTLVVFPQLALQYWTMFLREAAVGIEYRKNWTAQYVSWWPKLLLAGVQY